MAFPGRLVVALAGLLPAMVSAATIVIGDFADNGLRNWQEKSFQGYTDYELVIEDGRRVAHAESDASASGLYREQTIDLTQTPILEWRWKIANVLKDIDEPTKAGDDYPARVYVVFSGGLAFWRTRTVVYVWSSHQPQGSTWHNAYMDNARMIALQSGKEKTGQWLTERRNVRADYERLFGDDVEQADAVAIMTDTDNSAQQAEAWYGDIRFTDQP